MDVQVNDIWEDLTPGYQRFVRVTRVGKEGAFIQRVEYWSDAWIIPKRSVIRETSLQRFNGKTGGFRLHERKSA